MHWTDFVRRRGVFPSPTAALIDAPPVVFLHGTLGSPGNFSRTAAAVQAAGRPVIGLEYNARGTGALRDSVAELRRELSALPRFDLVGHSMGGVVGLHLAAEFDGAMGTLVGVGSCWRGIPKTALHRLAGVLGPAYREALLPYTGPMPEKTRIVSVVSDSDRTVPVSSATLGEVIMVHGVHHAHLPNQAAAILTALQLRPGAEP